MDKGDKMTKKKKVEEANIIIEAIPDRRIPKEFIGWMCPICAVIHSPLTTTCICHPIEWKEVSK